MLILHCLYVHIVLKIIYVIDNNANNNIDGQLIVQDFLKCFEIQYMASCLILAVPRVFFVI